MTDYRGRPGAPGVALGRLLRIDRPAHATRAPSKGAGGLDVRAAFDAVVADLRARAERLRTAGQTEPADILDATALIAADPDLRASAIAAAATANSGEVAVAEVVEAHAQQLAALPEPTLAARAADVRQVGRLVTARIRGEHRSRTAGPVVLVAEEVGADDVADPESTVIGAVSVRGGAGSHAAIVARAVGVPMVFDIDPAVLDLPDGGPVVIDGGQGLLTVSPTDAQREAARGAMLAAAARRQSLAGQRDLPCVTADGHPVALLANVATAADAVSAITAGVGGAGLVRTELRFLKALTWPTQAEHAEALRPVLAALTGRPVTVRTLDFAPDKLPPFLSSGGLPAHERGLKLMLDTPDALDAQLRAVLTEAHDVKLRIMFPMVASIDELRACRRAVEDAARAVGTPRPPVGAMVELPEAVAIVDELAAEADFLSVGSNDLTAALLDLDRRASALGPELAAHPRVLRAIAETVAAAHRHAITVSVCGDAAAHPAVVPLLVGLRVDALSVPPAAVDEVRELVRSLDYLACERQVRQALV